MAFNFHRRVAACLRVRYLESPEGGGGAGGKAYFAAGDYGGKVQVWEVGRGGSGLHTMAYTK